MLDRDCIPSMGMNTVVLEALTADVQLVLCISLLFSRSSIDVYSLRLYDFKNLESTGSEVVKL